jgi:hypothetical protein
VNHGVSVPSGDPTPFDNPLERDIVATHGYLIGGDALRKLLGYPTPNALHQAVRRRTVPVPVFTIEHRWGHFALAKDIAAWLVACRSRGLQDARAEKVLGESDPTSGSFKEAHYAVAPETSSEDDSNDLTSRRRRALSS